MKWRITEAQSVLLQYLLPTSRPLLPHHQEGPSACFFFTWWPSGSVKLELSIYTQRWAHLFRSYLCVCRGAAVSQSSQELPWVGVCCCHALCAPARGADSRDLTWGQEDGGSLLVLLHLSSQQALRPEGRWGSGSVCSGCHNEIP